MECYESQRSIFCSNISTVFSRMNHSHHSFRHYRSFWLETNSVFVSFTVIPPTCFSSRECNHPANQPLTKETFEFKKGLDYMAFYLYLTSWLPCTNDALKSPFNMCSGRALKADSVILSMLCCVKKLVFEQGSPEVCRCLFCL